MGNILEDNYSIFFGLYTALARTRKSAQNTYYKVLEAQRQYLIGISGGDFSDEQEKAMTLLDDALHKFYLGAYSLEQLWSVHDYLEIADHGMPYFFDSKMTIQQNEIVFLLSSLLDQSLYSWRSFLDYYLKYLMFVSTNEYAITMSTKNFRKGFENHINKNPDDLKARNIYRYIKSKVLCQTLGGEDHCWGDLLRSLRDKTTHQKLIKPNIEERENLQGYKISWPMIGGKNYSEIAQWEFENNAFEMLRELFPILYGFDWIAGPYKPGMYN